MSPTPGTPREGPGPSLSGSPGRDPAHPESAADRRGRGLGWREESEPSWVGRGHRGQTREAGDQGSQEQEGQDWHPGGSADGRPLSLLRHAPLPTAAGPVTGPKRERFLPSDLASSSLFVIDLNEKMGLMQPYSTCR